MAGEGASKNLAADEARLKRAQDSATAAATGGVGSSAGKAPFLENFIIRPHLYSQLNKSNLSQYRKVYGIPSEFNLRLPLRTETSKSFPNNSVCIFLDSLVLGLRLPLAEPIVDLMNHTGCVPAMFAPNALPLLLATHAAFELEDLPWSIPNFFSLFTTNLAEEFISFKARYVHRFSILGFPSSHGTWKSKYFFAVDPEGFPFDVNPGFLAESVFQGPSTMDPAIVEYTRTPRQLYTDDLLPPFLNPSGTVKAMAVPRASKSRARAAGRSGEGGSTYTPPEGSTPPAGPEVSTSQTLRQKRSSSPRVGASKAMKSAAGASAGGSSAKSTKQIVDLSEGDEEEREEEERGGGGDPTGPFGFNQEGYDLPTNNAPVQWLGESGMAMVKSLHDCPTQAMGGDLTDFPMQVGELVRSRQDVFLRQAWPRDQVIPKAMEQGLDAFNTLFYMCQMYAQGMKDEVAHTAEKEKMAKEAAVVDTLRLAAEGRANSLEADVERLTTLNLALCKERDEKVGEVAALQKAQAAEAVKARERAEADKKAIEELRKTIVDLKAAYNRVRDALAASEKSAEAAKGKAKEAEDGAEKQGKELIALKMEMANPQSLQKSYRETELYRVEMEHFMKEGVDMAREYLLRDILKEGMSMEDCRKAIDEIDFDDVRDADLAAGEEREDNAEGENST